MTRRLDWKRQVARWLTVSSEQSDALERRSQANRQWKVNRRRPVIGNVRQRGDGALSPVTTNGTIMMNEPDTPSWESARLIPVSGIRNAEEQERRGTRTPSHLCPTRSIVSC